VKFLKQNQVTMSFKCHLTIKHEFLIQEVSPSENIFLCPNKAIQYVWSSIISKFSCPNINMHHKLQSTTTKTYARFSNSEVDSKRCLRLVYSTQNHWVSWILFIVQNSKLDLIPSSGDKKETLILLERVIEVSSF
jgi:hypothetical protein